MIRRFNLLLIFVIGFFLSCEEEQNFVEISGKTMGTTYRILIADPTAFNVSYTQIKDAVDSVLVSLNQNLSNYIPDSELSLFNKRKELFTQILSDDFATVMKTAKETFIRSNGAFDVTVAPAVNLWGFGHAERKWQPPEQADVDFVCEMVGMEKLKFFGNTIEKLDSNVSVDLSAIAKGFGVDKVSEYLLETYGFQNTLVDIGGELFCRGERQPDVAWKVGVENPKNNIISSNIMETIAIKDMAVATSGSYRNFFDYNNTRFSHSINPETCSPVTHTTSLATVIAENCMLADAMATASMVLGAEKGLEIIESLENLEAYFVSSNEDGKYIINQSSGFEKWEFKNK